MGVQYAVLLLVFDWMTVKTINSKILGNNRERIAGDSKSNHATNTTETFFVVVVFVCFALGNV